MIIRLVLSGSMDGCEILASKGTSCSAASQSRGGEVEKRTRQRAGCSAEGEIWTPDQGLMS